MQISLRTLRQMHRRSIGEMAEIAGVSTATYRLYEQNPQLVPVQVARRLVRLGSASVDDIFFGE